MVDGSTNEDFDATSEQASALPDIITELVAGTAIPGIPAPVRRNFLKAFGQLCTAAIDIPDEDSMQGRIFSP